MTRLERVGELATSREVFLAFVALSALPFALAAISFRQPFRLPPSALSYVEVLFRLLVYVPATAVSRLLFEPFGLENVYSVPVIGHVAVFLSLIAVYYCLSLLLVTVIDAVLRRSG